MALYRYSHKVSDEKKVARAQVHDVNASYKDLTQVLAAIRYKPYVVALQVLEDAIAKKKAIRFKKFAKNLGHRSELGGAKGKYPIKEAKFALALIKNAKANADAKGLDAELLRVASAAAYKQDMFMRYRRKFVGSVVIGYGRQSFASKYVTCWAEVTLDEAPGKSKHKQQGKVQESGKKTEKPAEQTSKGEVKQQHKQEEKKHGKEQEKKQSNKLENNQSNVQVKKQEQEQVKKQGKEQSEVTV